jgi:hypothetical protein
VPDLLRIVGDRAQHQRSADDDVERRAQLVRKGGEELVLEPARDLGVVAGPLLAGQESRTFVERGRGKGE